MTDVSMWSLWRLCAVWPDTPARGIVHGSHEHRNVLTAVWGESKLPDREGWNAVTSRHTCQPDRYHSSFTSAWIACRRQGSGLFNNHVDRIAKRHYAAVARTLCLQWSDRLFGQISSKAHCLQGYNTFFHRNVTSALLPLLEPVAITLPSRIPIPTSIKILSLIVLFYFL